MGLTQDDLIRTDYFFSSVPAAASDAAGDVGISGVAGAAGAAGALAASDAGGVVLDTGTVVSSLLEQATRKTENAKTLIIEMIRLITSPLV